jgi:hypothetical protein
MFKRKPQQRGRNKTKMKNAIGSAITLVTLIVGISIGLMLSPRLEHVVSAQKPAPTPICTSTADIECVSPIMTVGSAGIGTLLSNRISTDQLTVNGYDILKLQNNLLNTLQQTRTITAEQAQAIARDSHPDKQLRYQPPTPAPTPAPPTK